MKTRKLTVKIPARLWQSFSEMADAAFINRTAFLDNLLVCELPKVEHDLSGYVLTPQARRHIATLLKTKNPIPVTFEIKEATAEKLNQVVADHGLNRDALIGRIIFFVRVSDAWLTKWELPTVAGSLERVMTFELEASPMKALQSIHSDPLQYIRAGILGKYRQGIYSFDQDQSLDWAACMLPDKRVPGTQAYMEEKQMWDDFHAD